MKSERLQNVIIRPDVRIWDASGNRCYEHGLSHHWDSVPVGIDDTLPLDFIPEPCFFLGGNANFGHMIFEYLPRLVYWTEGPVFMWSHVPLRFHELLRVLDPSPQTMIGTAGKFMDVTVSTAAMGRDVKGTPYVIPQAVQWVRDHSWPMHRGKPKLRVYAPRKAKWRRIVNESEVESALVKEGFEIVDLDSMSMAKQVALVSACEILVLPMGAGSPIALWVNARGRIIEMGPPGIAGPFGGRVFSYVAGVPFTKIVGKNAAGEDGRDADYTVSVPELLAAVRSPP